ncbi:hypothetical protein [Flavobacterium sp. B17]|uniref:hypothetical protein n=1 Tax=Flavobacterium sp. B17 TaxID=95618 RepID=UPI00034AB6B5|nr:hypothetical protein [Flavobacterium sp. B17]
MIFISKILFFASHHGFYTVIILLMIFGLLSAVTKKVWMLILVIPLGVANAIGGQYLNAWFLNKYGTESTAIITSDVVTNSTLNEQYIHDYEAIVKKQDGHYINTFFSTTSASIYPIENAIRIPMTGKAFPVKFIPGYEKNIVILYQQSEEGKRLRQYQLIAPVNTTRIKYEADPDNMDFRNEYIEALQNYLNVYNDEKLKTELLKLQSESK